MRMFTIGYSDNIVKVLVALDESVNEVLTRIGFRASKYGIPGEALERGEI